MKEKILRATAKLISEHGLESASTRTVCDAVGITSPTLYYYFKSKELLIDSVTQYAFNIHRENKKKIRTEDSFLNLKIYWDEYIRFSLEEPELHRSMIIAVSEGRMTKTGFNCFEDLVAEFKNLEKDQNLNKPALECAQIYLGAAQGISMIFMSLPKQKSLPPISDSTRDILLSALIKDCQKKSLTLLTKNKEINKQEKNL